VPFTEESITLLVPREEGYSSCRFLKTFLSLYAVNDDDDDECNGHVVVFAAWFVS